MSHSESDITNVKTLMLLQSSKPESTHALRTMLIDAIINKYGSKRQTKPIPPIWQMNTENSKQKFDDVHKTKSRLESKKGPRRSTDSTGSTGSSSDEHEGALQILEGNLNNCSVCRGERFPSKTHLIECSECHLLYHKQCHSPPITEDLSDPRLVWYCRHCNKSVSKPKISDTSSSKYSGHKSNSSNMKGSHSSSLLSGSKTFGGTRISHSKSSTSSSSSKPHIPNINIISADKRLQIMKKKAAKKQDKRALSK